MFGHALAGGGVRGGALPHVPASSQAEAAFGYGAGFGVGLVLVMAFAMCV